MRLRIVVAVAVCAVAVGVLLFGGLASNLVYFRTVSEAVAARPTDGDGRLRVAGAVVPGSVRVDGDLVSFDLTDGAATVAVAHRGDPPELFDDGAPVVSEGSWNGNVFHSDRLMIKHGSDYSPPDAVADGEQDGDEAHRADEAGYGDDVERP